uniref:SAM domain-containing protein n=1 Tax=Meloidogyne hapla TaxID=6305 RepID=A0A1I8B196_MELHA
MFLSLITILQLLFISAKLDKTTKNIKVTSEDEKLRDQEGYLAIKAIHGVLDNDHSGSIERYESADFLTEDLKFGESEREKREKAFHGNDESITVDDLWDAWFQSDVREWDEKQVIDWLVNGVKLPQYVNNFMKAGITGTDFPRLAAQNSSIFNSLDIKNSVHRQKLQLKALDLVLFGSQDSSSLIKDIALACLLISLISLLIIFKAYKNRARKQMEELSTRLSKLRDMETDFEGVHQQKLGEENKAHNQQPSDDNNGEASATKGYNYNPVLDFENEQRLSGAVGGDLGLGGMDGGEHYFFLQTLLRRTYEIESAYLDKQRTDCLLEMREAMELVDKMRRKQSSIMNSLKLATGATSGTDDIDTKIFSLKARMEKIKQGIEELVQRWMKIESLCGFSITGPFGESSSQILPNIQFSQNLHSQDVSPSSSSRPSSSSSDAEII